MLLIRIKAAQITIVLDTKKRKDEFQVAKNEQKDLKIFKEKWNVYMIVEWRYYNVKLIEKKIHIDELINVQRQRIEAERMYLEAKQTMDENLTELEKNQLKEDKNLKDAIEKKKLIRKEQKERKLILFKAANLRFHT